MDTRQSADNNKAYYYHFDGLGSVVALSNSNGDSCQSYEYSAYGQVAASDPNHPNPYMFTGRRFDIETGLYYYRARYYNPHIGRFMQTDPVGYGAGINWYLYCWNNPLSWIDSTGREPQRPNKEGGYNNSERPWERADGHPDPPHYYPYYVQQKRMSCSAAAILNWWLTYDIPLPTNWGGLNDIYDTDAEAEEYVRGRLRGADHNWKVQGIDDLSLAGNVAGDYTKKEFTPTYQDLMDVVDAEKAAMIGVAYGTPLKDGGGNLIGWTNKWWHVVLVVPTLQDLDNMEGVPYSVITGFGTQPLALSEKSFEDWFNSLAGVHNEWLEGGTVPGRD